MHRTKLIAVSMRSRQHWTGSPCMRINRRRVGLDYDTSASTHSITPFGIGYLSRSVMPRLSRCCIIVAERTRSPNACSDLPLAGKPQN